MSEKGRPSRAFSLLVPLFSLVVTFALVETGLRIAESRFGFNHFETTRLKLYESFYYHFLTPQKEQEILTEPDPPKIFDPLMGWRDWQLGDPKWVEENSRPSARHKVVLVGSSFMRGSDRLNTEDKIADALQKELGEKYQVLDLSALGYANDQIYLAATRIAPKFHPDLIVIAPTMDSRSACTDCRYNAKKPYFTLDGDRLVLHGVPPLSPRANLLASHHSFYQRLRDTVLAALYRSRTFCIVGQLFLQKAYNDCTDRVNPTLIQRAFTDLKGVSRVLLVNFQHHDTPAGEKAVEAIQAPRVTLWDLEARLPAAERAKCDRFNDGHPKGYLNRLYAREIAMGVRKELKHD